MPQRSILIADDVENQTEAGKRRSQAVRDAASSLASRLHTGIDLLYVEDLKTYIPPLFNTTRVRLWHSRHQRRLDEAARGFSILVRTILKNGYPPNQILQTLHGRTPPEFVVMGTRGRKGLQRLIVGSVAEEVIRNSRRPVMVIGPAAREQNLRLSGRKQLNILVATDLGRNSRPAEHYALSLARRMSARVFLFHCLWDSYRVVLRDSALVSGWVPINSQEILKQIHDGAVTVLNRKVRFFRDRGVSCDCGVHENEALTSCAIYEEAGKGYDLVVMGTRGRNMLLESFFGSTARETILSASVPVITVRSGY